MDEIDLMQKTEELEFKGNIKKSKDTFRVGPKKCIKCNDYNDRSEDGFGVCSDCMEIMEESAVLSIN